MSRAALIIWVVGRKEKESRQGDGVRVVPLGLCLISQHGKETSLGDTSSFHPIAMKHWLNSNTKQSRTGQRDHPFESASLRVVDFMKFYCKIFVIIHSSDGKKVFSTSSLSHDRKLNSLLNTLQTL